MDQSMKQTLVTFNSYVLGPTAVLTPAAVDFSHWLFPFDALPSFPVGLKKRPAANWSEFWICRMSLGTWTPFFCKAGPQEMQEDLICFCWRLQRHKKPLALALDLRLRISKLINTCYYIVFDSCVCVCLLLLLRMVHRFGKNCFQHALAYLCLCTPALTFARRSS